MDSNIIATEPLFAAAAEVLAAATVGAFTTSDARVRTAPRLRIAQGTGLSAAGPINADDRKHTTWTNRNENVPAQMFVATNGIRSPRGAPQ
ncbi:MAG: hypothetical protein ABJA87_02300 [bacterium]